MSFEDGSSHSKNLQGEDQQQAFQKIVRSSATTYADMFNAALFPLRLYQQSLVMVAQVTLGNLRAATGAIQQGMGSSQPTRRSAEAAEGATQDNMQTPQQSTTTDVATERALQQGVEVGDDKTAWQDMEAINQAAQDKMRAASQAALRQNAEEAPEEITRESYAETADRILTEVDEVASSPSEPVSPPSLEEPNATGELPPSPAPDVTAGPVAKAAVDETDEGSTETSSRVAGDKATFSSASVPKIPEESVSAEGPSPPTREELPSDEGMNTMEELTPPAEVLEVDLPPPTPVPQNILDELPPPPVLEALDEPADQDKQREAPRIHVRRGTAAARRKAEELNVDLAEVEGAGRDGQITVGDVRKKAEEKRT